MSQPLIFDQNLIETFRKRAFLRYKHGADFLLKLMAEDLVERLLTVKRQFEKAADVHSHNGVALDFLKNSGKVNTIVQIETDKAFHKAGFNFLQRDRATLGLAAKGYDLIVSLLSLHMVDDVVGSLIQIKNSIKPDGLFLSVVPGTGTLGELRACLLQAENEFYGGASARVYPFLDIRDAGALLQRVGFAMPVTDVENLTVRYDNVFALIADLRAMGMQNALKARSRKPLAKGFFKRVDEIYKQQFSDVDGRIRASFSFVWLSGWAPDASQQQPMKPGTAKVSLADILSQEKD